MTALSLSRCVRESQAWAQQRAVGGVIPVMFLRAGCWQDLQLMKCWPQGFSLASQASPGTIDGHQPVHSTTSHRQGNTHAYALLPLSFFHTPLINLTQPTLHPYGQHKLGSVVRSKNKTQSLVQSAPNRHQGATWRRWNTIQLGLEINSKYWNLILCN